MKNIVKVLRFKDNAARFYALPDGVTVKVGTLVTVEFPDRFNTCVGVAVSDSYVVDDNTAQMIMQFCKMLPAAWENMKKVISVYDENPVDWPVDDADEDAEKMTKRQFTAALKKLQSTEETDDDAEETEDEE